MSAALKEQGCTKRNHGCVVRFRISRRVKVKLNVRCQCHPFGNAPGPIGFQNFFGAVVEFLSDGFFVYFVICAGKTDLVQRIAVQRVVVNHAQNPGLVDFFLVAGYAVDSAENAELLI